MSWRRFLFSPSGRFNRARYWKALCLQYGTGVSVWVPFAVVEDGFADRYPILSMTYAVFAVVVTATCIVSHVITEIKRFHDRDKSWPWIFISFIPYVGGIWILVELGILPGTKGRNRFGADPLGRHEDIIDVFGPPDGALPGTPLP